MLLRLLDDGKNSVVEQAQDNLQDRNGMLNSIRLPSR
jgi:hypothetical protein